MSAYICDPDHIKELALFAVRKADGDHFSRNVEPCYLERDGGQDMGGKCDDEIATYYADMLYQENIRGVRARYPEDTWEDLPGPCEKPLHLIVTPREFTRHLLLPRTRRPAPVAILKLIACLRYQSCDSDDYEQSLAYRLLGMIQEAAIQALPGYDTAPWDFTAA